MSYLSIERAIEYVGDRASVMSLLVTLQNSLKADLPRISGHLAGGDMGAANGLLHQIKGFAPVFCVDSLVTEVIAVEHLSKGHDLAAAQNAYAALAPKLEELLEEVQQQLTQG